MTERERLIALINAKQIYGIDQDQPKRHDMLLLDNEDLADYLLANGVIVAPMPMAKWLRQELAEHVYERCMEEL